MKMTRFYPLIVGGFLLPGMAHAQTAQQDETTLVVTASKQSSRSASANNVSSTVISATELSDAGVTASDKLPECCPDSILKIAAICFFNDLASRHLFCPGLL